MSVHHDPHTNINGLETIQQRLMDLLLADQTIDQLLAVLSQVLGQTVLLVDMAGRVLADDQDSGLQRQLRQFINAGIFPTLLQTQPQLSLQAARFGLDLTPLVLSHDLIGLLIVQAEPRPQIKATLRQSSPVMALSLLKFQAAQDQMAQQRQALLDDLLTGAQPASRHWLDQARDLGWELASKSVALVLKVGTPSLHSTFGSAKPQPVSAQFQAIIAQVLDQHCPQSIVAFYNQGFIILPHLSGSMAAMQDQVKAVLDQLVTAFKAAHIQERYVLACGDFHSGLEGVRQSYQEAEQAVDVGTRLNMQRPIRFEEIYLYLLLERSGRDEAARDWVQRTLDPLLAYDQRNKTEMLQTLEAYFDTNQTLQDAAYALHIHPNTLKYRLGRIAQILDQDPFKGENQLRFYLATKMARLLGLY